MSDVSRAIEILEELEPFVRNMTQKSAVFVTDMLGKYGEYGDDLYVSDAQLSWLEDLYERHCG